jgi:hypothetical protein
MVSTLTFTRRAAKVQRLIGWTLSYDRFLSDLSVDPNPDYLRLFDETGIALIHIPKTGGTSLSHALYGRGIWHRRWDQIRDADPTGFERWLKVAVIRNPVDRFVSAFAYLKAGGSNEFDKFISKRFMNCDLETFVERLAIPARRHPVMDYWHFRPQSDFVLSADGHLMVDRLIPFDSLAEGARNLGIVGLPRLNAADDRHDSRPLLTPEIRARVETMYRRDVDLYVRLIVGASLGGR